MSDRRKPPPNAWAALLREIADRPGWSVNRLAKDSGIHRATIFRWLGGALTNIKVESVRLIADAAGVDYTTALRAAGKLPEDDPAEDDWELRMIRQSGLPPKVIDQLVTDTLERRRRERDSRRQELERQIDLLRGAATT